LNVPVTAPVDDRWMQGDADARACEDELDATSDNDDMTTSIDWPRAAWSRALASNA